MKTDKEKLRVPIICIVIFIILGLSVLVWNYIIAKNKEEDNQSTDVSTNLDYNNVSIVDEKLGEDFRITQSYLMNYVIKKTGTWYMSEGYVSSLKNDGDYVILTISKEIDSKETIEAQISKDNCNVKKGDTVFFVGVINFKKYNLKLTKIDTEIIDYKSVTSISFEELYNNLNSLKKTYFIVSGYMVTDGDKFKLFDSKEAYLNDDSSGNYFLLNWDGEFLYTGNQNVIVRCLLTDTYSLSYCTLEE